MNRSLGDTTLAGLDDIEKLELPLSAQRRT